MSLNSPKVAQPSLRRHRYDVAEHMFLQLEAYSFDLDRVRRYPEDVRAEIAHAAGAVRQINATAARWFFRYSERRAVDTALNGDDAVEREQACWELAQRSPDALRTLVRSIETSPSDATAISILLAARKIAYQDPDAYLSVLGDLCATTTHRDLREWALISRCEYQYLLTGDPSAFDASCVEGEPVRLAPSTFDVTVPLIFECTAEISIGGHAMRLKLSPAYFEKAIGQAIACLRCGTYETDLVLEKNVPAIHPDGSPHFEHFAFSGETQRLGPSLYHHNYWANCRRPYYTSSRTEAVSARYPVLRDVPMTFARMAMTTAPAKYATPEGPAPETVRGVFFGFGDIPAARVLARGFRLLPGDFQITGHRNPRTGKPANTRFFGTFYGKIGDRDADERIVMNARPTHCSPAGVLDYRGDGTMMPDPFG